jgi:hypothetical protein
MVTKAALALLYFGEHVKQHLIYLALIPNYKLILGDPWLSNHNPQVNFIDRYICFNSAKCFKKGCLKHARPCTMYAQGSPMQPTKRETPTANIQFVSAHLFFMLAKRRDHHGFIMMPRQQTKQLYAITTGAVQPEDYNKFMARAPKYTLEELKKRVPREYHSVIKVFLKEEVDQLPPHHPKDHDIQLVNSADPPFSHNY